MKDHSAPARLRILFYTGIDVTLAEGHATHVRRLVDAFVARGHRVRCLSLRATGPVSWGGPPDGIRVIKRPSVPRVGHWVAQLRARSALLEETRAFQPDLVLARMESLTAAPLSLPRHVPLCVESNSSSLGHAKLSNAGWIKQSLERALEGAMLRRAAVVGVAAPALADLHHERYRIDRSRIVFVPNGAFLPILDAQAGLRARRDLGYPDDAFVIGFIGNLTRWQGLELLLETLRAPNLRQVRLWIAGGGAGRAELAARIANLRLEDQVRMLGPMLEQEAAVLAQTTQLLVAPYDEESMRLLCGSGVPTMKVLFAMACDRPFLAGAIPSVEPIGAGESVASDPDAWIRALERWQERWKHEGRPLIGWPWRQGEGPGRRYVASQRTWDHTAQTWERAFSLIDW